jgi:hypothetical protein
VSDANSRNSPSVTFFPHQPLSLSPEGHISCLKVKD